MSICKHILTKIKAFKSIHLMKTDLSEASCFRGGGWRCVRDGRELCGREQRERTRRFVLGCPGKRLRSARPPRHHHESFFANKAVATKRRASRNTTEVAFLHTPRSKGTGKQHFRYSTEEKNFSFLSAHPSNGVELSTIQVTLSVDPSES
jgi:hypothetical protein